MTQNTVMILRFWTNRTWQTVQTQIRHGFLEEQSDQGLHCLHSISTFWTIFFMERPLCLNFRVITANILGVLEFWNFTVINNALPKFGEIFEQCFPHDSVYIVGFVVSMHSIIDDFLKRHIVKEPHHKTLSSGFPTSPTQTAVQPQSCRGLKFRI